MSKIKARVYRQEDAPASLSHGHCASSQEFCLLDEARHLLLEPLVWLRQELLEDLDALNCDPQEFVSKSCPTS